MATASFRTESARLPESAFFDNARECTTFDAPLIALGLTDSQRTAARYLWEWGEGAELIDYTHKQLSKFSGLPIAFFDEHLPALYRALRGRCAELFTKQRKGHYVRQTDYVRPSTANTSVMRDVIARVEAKRPDGPVNRIKVARDVLQELGANVPDPKPDRKAPREPGHTRKYQPAERAYLTLCRAADDIAADADADPTVDDLGWLDRAENYIVALREHQLQKRSQRPNPDSPETGDSPGTGTDSPETGDSPGTGTDSPETGDSPGTGTVPETGDFPGTGTDSPETVKTGNSPDLHDLNPETVNSASTGVEETQVDPPVESDGEGGITCCYAAPAETQEPAPVDIPPAQQQHVIPPSPSTSPLVSALPLRLDGIPQQIGDYEQRWVAWRYGAMGENGKRRKIPINPDTGAPASSTNPLTWGWLDQAVDARVRYGCDGVAFMVEGGPYVALDFDNCLDGVGKITDPQVERWVDALDSYTEISPSGTGLHVLTVATLPAPGTGFNGVLAGSRIEIYGRGRMICMTGHLYPGTSTHIENSQHVVERIYCDALATKKRKRAVVGGTDDERGGLPSMVRISDDLALRVVGRSKSAEQFRRLWDGDRDGYGSDSDADWALLSILAPYCWDADQLVRIAGQSKLIRDKWTEGRVGKTWLDYSAQNAMRERAWVYTAGVRHG